MGETTCKGLAPHLGRTLAPDLRSTPPLCKIPGRSGTVFRIPNGSIGDAMKLVYGGGVLVMRVCSVNLAVALVGKHIVHGVPCREAIT